MHSFGQSTKDLNSKSWGYLQTNLDSARFYALKAKKAAEENKEANELGKALNRIALVHRYSNNLDSAIYFFELGLEQRTRAGNKEGYVANLQNIASTLRQQGDYTRAKSRLLEGLEIANTENYLEEVAGCYGQLGIIETRLANWEQAIEHISKSAGVYNQLEMSNKEASQREQLAECYAQTKQKELALDELKYSGDLRGEVNNPVIRAKRLNTEANIYFHSNEFQLAQRYYLESLKVSKETGREILIANAHQNLGASYRENGQMDAAISSFKKAINLYSSLGANDNKRHSLSNLSEAYQAKGDHKNGLLTLQEFNSLNDSMVSLEQQTAMDRMQVEFDVREKDLQNDKLTAENRKKRLGNLALVFSLFLLGIISLLSFRHLKKKKTIAEQESLLKQKELESFIAEQELHSVTAMLDGQERERKRIAKDLHDRLGALLSTVKLHFSGMEEQIKSLESNNRDQYSKALALLDDSVSEVRRISHAMESGLHTQGLEQGLSDLKEQLESTNQVKVELETGSIDELINHKAATQLFRVIQELVTNSLRHGQADEISIQFTAHENEINLMVEDNGKGFNPATREEGLGTKSIQYRISGLGGTVRYDSQPGKGATAIIEIPRKENQ